MALVTLREGTMAVLIAMLRGVNIGSHQKVSMAELRTLCTGLGLRGVQTYIQSGNVLFHEESGDLSAVAGKLDQAIEKRFGFRPGLVLRTAAELRKVVAKNPFAGRAAVQPNQLLVVFLTVSPTRQAREKILAVDCPEELRVIGRELYIYYPEGMAHPKISIVRIEKMLGSVSTGRNLNTVNKLLAMAELLQDSLLDHPT
jgi:uncharacterized protein (DUF1697 family)